MIGEKQCNNILLFEATENISDAYIYGTDLEKIRTIQKLTIEKERIETIL